MINHDKMEVTCHRCATKIPLINSTLIDTDKNAKERAYGICPDCQIVIEMTELDGMKGWDQKKTYSDEEAFLIMSKLIKALIGE